MKNFSALKWLNSRLEQGEEMINELKDKATEILQYEEQIEKRMNKSEQRLRDLWDITAYQHTSKHPKGEKRKGQQNI